MSKSEKIIEYKKLKNKINRFFVEFGKITITKDTDISPIVKKITVVGDKMKEIVCSLNEDEKKEFKQLELIDDDDIDKAKKYALDKLELDLKNDLITVEEYLIKRKELGL